MNRRAFLTTAAMTPILASAFGRVRAQTAGGRLLYVGTYTNSAAGSKGIYAWRFDAADEHGHVAGSRRGNRQSQLGRGPSQQTISVRRE